MVTWTQPYKLSNVIAHIEDTVLVKPKCTKNAYKKLITCIPTHALCLLMTSNATGCQDEISRVSIILKILILYQVSSFSFGVSTLESPPFPCSSLSIKCKMSCSSIIHEQRSCMAKGSVVESEILCTLSRLAT
jgi:hypothetical protein